MSNSHNFSFAGAAASWLVALAAQVSGYTNPYVAWVLFLIGAAFFLLAVRDWSRTRGWLPISLRDARIPYVKIRTLANEKGWKLNDDSPACVNRAYYLEGQMQQAAVEGSLLVWGCKCEAPIGSNPLLQIPKKHFKDFTFRHGFLTRDNVENISTYTWKLEIGKNSSSFGRGNYCDLYVSQSNIKRLLCRVPPSDGVVRSSID
jgi:hypothetical protein